jgi:translation initiation factor 1
MSQPGKISTEGGTSLGQNPFGALSAAGLPAAPGRGADLLRPSASGVKRAQQDCAPTGLSRPAAKNRGRVDIVRETGGRGGKTVTVAKNFVGIGLPEKEALAKKMRAACGCGGTVKDGAIEIQGDQRETVARILTEAGFRPVFAGG